MKLLEKKKLFRNSLLYISIFSIEGIHDANKNIEIFGSFSSDFTNRMYIQNKNTSRKAIKFTSNIFVLSMSTYTSIWNLNHFCHYPYIYIYLDCKIFALKISICRYKDSYKKKKLIILVDLIELIEMVFIPKFF